MPIVVGNDVVSNPIFKADLFAEHLQNINESGKHCLIDYFEKKLQDASCLNDDDYNSDIMLYEVKHPLSSSQNKGPDIDDISNVFLKNLPDNVLHEVVTLFNPSFRPG